MWDPYAAFQKATLPNGLTIYLATWDRPWLKVNFLINAGAKDDRKDRKGVAHYLEHLLSENIIGWTNEEIKAKFNEIGGYCNFGATGYTNTSFEFGVPLENNNLQLALDVYGQMIINCKVENFIERERLVILNEYKERFPNEKIAELLGKRRKLFFGDTKLGNYLRALGSLDSIQHLTQSDLQNFYDKYYAPSNISIIAVGGIELSAFVNLIQASPFASEKQGCKPETVTPILQFKPLTEINWEISALELYGQKPAQSIIEMHTALPFSTNPFAIEAAGKVLSKSLNKNLREARGLTYGFQFSKYRFPEAFELSINTRFSWNNLYEMQSLIDETIKNASIQTDQISTAIRDVRNDFKIHDLNASKLLEGANKDLTEVGKIVSTSEEKKKAELVTIEDVREIILAHLPERRLTITLHP